MPRPESHFVWVMFTGKTAHARDNGRFMSPIACGRFHPLDIGIRASEAAPRCKACVKKVREACGPAATP